MTILTVDEAFEALARGATLVTSSRRLARHLRLSYDLRQQNQGLTVWESADVLPWAAWLRRGWSVLAERAEKPENIPVLVDFAQETALFEAVIAGSLLNNENTLLNVRAAARQARSARKLLHEWVPAGAEIDWNATADTDAFHFWHTRYVRELKELAAIDESAMPDRLLSARPANWLDLARPVLLAGFDEYTPRQARLIARLRTAGVAMSEVRTRVRQRAERETVIGLRDADHEIREAAHWALALLERGERGSIAVVVPELARLRSRIEHAFTDILGSSALFNISLGRPLARYPVITAALQALALIEDDLPIATASAILRSPFVRGAETEIASRAKADSALRRAGALTINRRLFAKYAPDLAPIEDAPPRQSPAGWARTFSRLLAAVGWPGERERTSAEYQAVTEWGELLSRFAGIGAVVPGMTAEQAVRALSDLAEEIVWQPQADPAPVQVLGLLEMSGFEFEHLRVTGLSDDVWPARPKPHPFIPHAAQRRFEMPHATSDRELAFARAATDRLRASGRFVTFTYPRRVADQELRPSALLAGIPVAPAPDEPRLSWAEMIRDTAMPEVLTDEHGPGFTGTLQRGGARVLQDVAACPFRSFAVHRLGAQPLDTPTFGPDARDRGTLVHVALRNLGCERSPSRERIEQAVAAAIDAKREQMGIGPRLAVLERERLIALIENWLALEKTRSAEFRIVAQEAGRTVSVGGLELSVRMDRVDELADGRHVILDYKTGEPKTKQWETDRPDDPQLLLYAITHDRPLAAVAFAQIRADGTRYAGMARDGTVLPGVKATADGEWRDFFEGRREVLTELAAEFRAGVARVDPKRGACDYCDVTPLCRIREAAVVAGDL